ncbi:hypothetical protein [Neobacillus endophyticus]|nr:hypothetical protein [Neobacillus endophyticus]
MAITALEQWQTKLWRDGESVELLQDLVKKDPDKEISNQARNLLEKI